MWSPPLLPLSCLPAALLALGTLLSSAPSAARAPLPRSAPEAVGVDSGGVLRFVEALEKKIDAVHSFMLVRHGKVAAEGFWAPYQEDDRHIMYSVSKSFTSTAVGLASQEGLLDVNDLVLSHFPELAPKEPAEQMKNMRIRDLLRMVSGHQKDQNPIIKAQKEGQWTRAFLETQVEFKPGTHWVYNSANSYMLAAIVQKVSGTTVEEYLRPRLFDPLGIEPPLWGKSPEGVNLGDGGLTLHTEDLAKFGLLYLQKGVWNGKRILSEHWVADASARQASTGGNPDSNWDHGYGYQFWRNKVTGYRADGAFGQFSFVLPEHDTVLAMTSGTSDMNGVMNVVWEYLLPALRERPLPENRAGLAKLEKKLASLTLPPQAGNPSAPLAAEVSKQRYAFPDNELGISAASIDFSAAEPRLTFEEGESTHEIVCGNGRWVRGVTGFQRGISNVYESDHQGMAASCAWTGEHTFVAKLCFHETPYTLTSTFTFEKGQLAVDIVHNLRWGETKRPRITGKPKAPPR